MNFGEALDAMKRGEKVARKAWHDYEYLYIEDNVLNHFNSFLSENEKFAEAVMSSRSLLSNDWYIKIDMPKTGDIVQLKGAGKGIITKCRIDGKYTILIGDGNFIVCDIFNFNLTGENHLELVDDIRDFLHE